MTGQYTLKNDVLSYAAQQVAPGTSVVNGYPGTRVPPGNSITHG